MSAVLLRQLAKTNFQRVLTEWNLEGKKIIGCQSLAANITKAVDITFSSAKHNISCPHVQLFVTKVISYIVELAKFLP